MTQQDITVKAKKLIEEIPYITIASVTPQGEPWNSPVFAVHDEEYNFYWNSSPESQHSKNIANKADIFVSIYDTRGALDEGFGIYMQAEASIVADHELTQAILDIYFMRKGKVPLTCEQFLAGHQRFYVAKVKKCWVNCYDKTHTPADWKEEINLLM